MCLWDAEQRPLEEVRDLSNRMCKLRAELKQVWMMSGQCGLLIEVTDLMLRDEEPRGAPSELSEEIGTMTGMTRMTSS